MRPDRMRRGSSDRERHAGSLAVETALFRPLGRLASLIPDSQRSGTLQGLNELTEYTVVDVTFELTGSGKRRNEYLRRRARVPHKTPMRFQPPSLPVSRRSRNRSKSHAQLCAPPTPDDHVKLLKDSLRITPLGQTSPLPKRPIAQFVACLSVAMSVSASGSWSPSVHLPAVVKEATLGGVLVTAVLLLACYLAINVIYSLILHPLAGFPGPSLGAVSRIPFWVACIKGTQVTWMTQLHRRYGPVVRYSPNDLSYVDEGGDAWKAIHGHERGGREFPKAKEWFVTPANGASSKNRFKSPMTPESKPVHRRLRHQQRSRPRRPPTFPACLRPGVL